MWIYCDSSTRYISACFDGASWCLCHLTWCWLILVWLGVQTIGLSLFLRNRCPTCLPYFLSMKTIALLIEIRLVELCILNRLLYFLRDIACTESELLFVFLELPFEGYLCHSASLVTNFDCHIDNYSTLTTCCWRLGCIPCKGYLEPCFSQSLRRLATCDIFVWLLDVVGLFRWGPITLWWIFNAVVVLGMGGRLPALNSFTRALLECRLWLICRVAQLTLFCCELIWVLILGYHTTQYHYITHRWCWLLPTF